MPESNYQKLSHALCDENGRWTCNGLRRMIGSDVAYRRWLMRYVECKYGVSWRMVQREIRQEFLDRFAQIYEIETGEPLPPEPTNARTEFLYLFADSAARSLQMGINTLMI
jgi:hypothetical protein